MRVTLDIDADVWLAARRIARRERRHVGAVISELARQALASSSSTVAAGRSRGAPEGAWTDIGFAPIPARGVRVDNELINRLRDAEGI